MENGRKTKIIRVIMYSLTILVPLLAMENCSGWNEGSMEVSTCFIDILIFREFANLCYSGFLISAFLAFIPLLIYILIVIGITEFLVFFVKKIEKRE
jgi:hypothetical protein